MDTIPTGDKLFPLWGWLTVFFYLLEFVLWQAYGQTWCLWLWVGLPLFGIPLMVIILRKDHRRAHVRTREARNVLDYWIFAAAAIGVGGFLFGFAGIYEMVENPLICLLMGIGAFATGGAVRFRPMVYGGIAGAAIGIGAFLLQGDLFPYQLLCIVATAIVALVVPGHMFKREVGRGI